MSDRRIAMLLIILAIVLHVALIKYATNTIITRNDYSTVASIKVPPIQVIWFSVADFGCFKTPCTIGAAARETGLYSRFGLSNSVSVAVGIVLPIFLLMSAACAALRKRKDWKRILFAGLLLAAGSVVLAPFAYFFIETFGHEYTVGLSGRGVWLVVAIFVGGVAMLGTGIWLTAQTLRRRSSI